MSWRRTADLYRILFAVKLNPLSGLGLRAKIYLGKLRWMVESPSTPGPGPGEPPEHPSFTPPVTPARLGVNSLVRESGSTGLRGWITSADRLNLIWVMPAQGVVVFSPPTTQPGSFTGVAATSRQEGAPP